MNKSIVFEGNGSRPSHRGGGFKESEVMYTLNTTEQHAVATEETEYEVRRLTPTECARLMGFPPDWCADVPHSDSAEYKLWGNGITLCSVIPMMLNAVRVAEKYKEENLQRRM